MYALAGASIALEASAALMITGDKQGLRGTPKNEKGAKAKLGGKGEAKVFLGLKEGIDLAGALQWLNPEGFIDPKTPKKADPSKAIAVYTDVASVSAGVSLIQGLAATLGFECDYRDGYFVVAAKAGACLGLGGSGSVAGKVGAAQINQFFMCIAHQLKQADYKKMSALIAEEAFTTLNQIFYLVVSNNRVLESFIGSGAAAIAARYREIGRSVRQNGETLIKQIEQQVRSGWGWYSYMPPESRGALIKSVVDAFSQPRNTENKDLRQVAAFIINEMISTTQSVGHLENTLDRITVAMGEESGRNQGVQMINSIVSGTIFMDCIDRCETQLAKAEPLMGRPFMRNDEPEFRLAQFPLHHAGYPLA